MLESLAALGGHDTGQASVGAQRVCKSTWGLLWWVVLWWGQAVVIWSGVGWGAVS